MSEHSKIIHNQLDTNKDVNFLYSDLIRLVDIDAEFLHLLENAHENFLPAEKITELIDVAVRECIRHILRINQYLYIAKENRQELFQIYQHTWQQVCASKDVKSVLKKQHYPAIQQWLAGLYPADFVRALKQEQQIGQVCCAEYAAELQLAVLGIEPEKLREPILDMGCGFTAPLAGYLSAKGYCVFGFDRLVEKQTDCICEADWFSFDWSENKWGTIISHMAFSNHYRYAVLHNACLRQMLDDVFLRILYALKPQGCFIYAPSVRGLLNQVNENEFQITQKSIMPEVDAIRIQRIGEM